MIEIDRSGSVLRLTSKALAYRWNSFGEYSYTDNDHLSSNPATQAKVRKERIERGFPSRYGIHFQRNASKRKFPVMISLGFNDDGDYEKIRAYSTGVTKKELKKWETESIEWLIDKGIVKEMCAK